MSTSFVNDDRNMLKHASAMRRCSLGDRPSVALLTKEHAARITATKSANASVRSERVICLMVSPFQGSGLLVTDNLGLRSRGSLQPRL
jgi:hypothetical protein